MLHLRRQRRADGSPCGVDEPVAATVVGVHPQRGAHRRLHGLVVRRARVHLDLLAARGHAQQRVEVR